MSVGTETAAGAAVSTGPRGSLEALTPAVGDAPRCCAEPSLVSGAPVSDTAASAAAVVRKIVTGAAIVNHRVRDVAGRPIGGPSGRRCRAVTESVRAAMAARSSSSIGSVRSWCSVTLRPS